MKKYNLFKVLGIAIIVAWVLTLFIPASYMDYSGKVVTDSMNGVGIFGLFSNLSISISYFNGIAVFLIAVACFYAIMNKANLYENFVNKVSTVFKEKESLLIIITTIVFGIIPCVVSDPLILIVFIPFIYKVMKTLNIDNKAILSSTIVASLVGASCGIYEKSLFSLLSLELNTLLLVKIIILVLSLAILIFFTAPKKVEKKKTTKKSAKEASVKKAVKKVSSKDKKVNKVLYAVLTILFGTIGVNKFYAGKIKAGILNILFCWTLIPTILSIAEFITVLTEKADKNGEITITSSRRNNVLFGTGLVLFVLFIIGSIIPWESLFSNLTVFSDLNSWLSNIKIGKYALFNNIIGAPIVSDSTTGATTGIINIFGNWTTTDVSIFLVIITIIISICNNIKFDDFVATTADAIKKVLPIAITAMLISIVLVITVTSGINVTICNWIVSITKGFNIATITLSSIIGSVLTADFYYFVSTIGSVFTTAAGNTDYYGILALIMQNIYYIVMIIAPTSVALIIGLYYLDIPYGKWFKYIWKVLLSLLVIVIIASIVIFILV